MRNLERLASGIGLAAACMVPGDPVPQDPATTQAIEIVQDIHAYWDEQGLDVSFSSLTVLDESEQSAKCAPEDQTVFTPSNAVTMCYNNDRLIIGSAYVERLATALEAKSSDIQAIIIGHEAGHIIQDQETDPYGRFINELQADCYSGMYIGHERPELAELGRRLLRLISTTDANGEPTDELEQQLSDHGTAPQRTAAFDHGINTGSCLREDIETIAPTDPLTALLFEPEN